MTHINKQKQLSVAVAASIIHYTSQVSCRNHFTEPKEHYLLIIKYIQVHNKL